jgi:hypothetical protein
VLLSATEVLPVGLPCTRCDGVISSKGPGDTYWLGSPFPKPISHSRTVLWFRVALKHYKMIYFVEANDANTKSIFGVRPHYQSYIS